MRILALLALLQLGAAPRTAGKSHGVIHDSILDGVTFQEYARDGEEAPVAAGVLQLEPAALAFGARPLGAAHAERVTLHNRGNATLRLASVSGSTHSFHASFFLSKLIPPGGNTTFSVVFLGQREGPVETQLYLHTSHGTHKYPVSGVAVMSEYRLSPLVGMRLPRNATLAPTIYMHNPHDHPIQITEVHSWGGGVSLELPAGGRDGPQSLWLIAPHTTRAIVRVRLAPPPPPPSAPPHTAPHTAYIRIKQNGTSEVLVVPVEVGAEREAGPYAAPHALHVGLAGTRDPPTQIKLSLGNSGESWVRLRHAGLGGGAAACEGRGGGGAGPPPVDITLTERSLPPLSPPAPVASLTVYCESPARLASHSTAPVDITLTERSLPPLSPLAPVASLTVYCESPARLASHSTAPVDITLTERSLPPLSPPAPVASLTVYCESPARLASQSTAPVDITLTERSLPPLSPPAPVASLTVYCESPARLASHSTAPVDITLTERSLPPLSPPAPVASLTVYCESPARLASHSTAPVDITLTERSLPPLSPPAPVASLTVYCESPARLASHSTAPVDISLTERSLPPLSPPAPVASLTVYCESPARLASHSTAPVDITLTERSLPPLSPPAPVASLTVYCESPARLASHSTAPVDITLTERSLPPLSPPASVASLTVYCESPARLASHSTAPVDITLTERSLPPLSPPAPVASLTVYCESPARLASHSTAPVDITLTERSLPPLSPPAPVASLTVYCESPARLASHSTAPVDISLTERSLPPLSPPAAVVSLTVYWDRVFESGATYGEIHLTTADHCLTVPYHAHALPGALVFNASSLSFVTSSPDVMMEREFSVRNDFANAVHVTALHVSDLVRKHFAVTGFAARSVPAGAAATLFSVRLRQFDASLSLSAAVTLVTNVTDYHLPVHLYSGKLEPEWQWAGWAGGALELGALPPASAASVAGRLHNGNPVRVCLLDCGVELVGATLQFLGCLRGGDDAEPTPCSCLEAGERGALRLTVAAPAREATLRGRVWLRTEHARLQHAVGLRAARGRLLARPLRLRDCFPGTTCSERLRLESTLAFDFNLLNVTVHPPDPRFAHRMEQGEEAWQVAAHSSGTHGRVTFTPSLLCRPHCYSGHAFTETELQEWITRPTRDDWLATDARQLEAYAQRYANLTARHPAHNLTLQLHTSEVHNVEASLSARWSWPRLWSAGATAGLVGVGGRVPFNVTLRNPSATLPVLVQALLAATPPHRVPARLRTGECERTGCVWSPHSFRISATYLEDAELVRGGATPTLLLPPGGSARVQITFTPASAAQHASLLYLRNNLTALEALHLTGQGAVPSFKFGNRKPGSGTPLLFELTEKHLKDCERDRSRLSAPPNLTVKRSFTARNTGDITINVATFHINGFECEGYGFKVLNCEPFELNPNATHKVDIAFTPDFTLSKIRRTLILKSSLSTPVNYSLVTTVPAHLLAPCGASLSRPPWETYLRNATVSFMICVGLCVLAAGFLESDRILKTAMAAMARNSVVHPPLDLRSIGNSGKPWEWSDPPDRKEKVKMPAWSEERRLSDDSKLGKYEEVAPTKTKKKLSKKYSSEPASTEVTPEKEPAKDKKEEEWRDRDRETTNGEVSENRSEDNSTPPSEARDTTKLLPSPEDSPKILDIPKKNLATLSASDAGKSKRHPKTERRTAPRCEEDASSTATESSNNDETEKEPDAPQRASAERTVPKKSSPTNTKKKCPSQYKDSYEGDGEDEEYDRPNKPTTVPAPYAGLSLKFQRNKDSNAPTHNRQNKPEPEKVKPAEPKIEQPQEAVHQTKPKAVPKFTSSKKDKIAKKKSEKVHAYTTRTEIPSTSSNCSRNSPPAVTVPSSRWGENRATFSDVVARSETVAAPKKTEAKPDKPKDSPVFTFERKTERPPLGPIGSNVFQKSAPVGRGDENPARMYSHPVRQIEPPAPKPLEELADNNNSFFYFGNDHVRSPEVPQPREVGVIGKPTTPVFPTPISQTFGQISYSPSILEDYVGLESGRAMSDGSWELRRDSPGSIAAPNTATQANAFARSIYPGDISTAYKGLWDLPTTTANSPIGPVGQSVGSIGQSVGPVGHSVGSIGQSVGQVGHSVGSIGQSVGPVGHSVGSIGQSVGPVGHSVGSIGHSVGSIGQSVGSIGQSVGPIGHSVGTVGQPLGPVGLSVGTVGQAASLDDKSAHAQWLWGYNGVRPPPGFPPTQQPVARPFELFQPNSIWGPPDHWSSRKDDSGQPQ